jgi:hypothetical protein
LCKIQCQKVGETDPLSDEKSKILKLDEDLFEENLFQKKKTIFSTNKNRIEFLFLLCKKTVLKWFYNGKKVKPMMFRTPVFLSVKAKLKPFKKLFSLRDL